MKKNKIMRFASLVLVLTLLSTCAISGTFAKYTSTASAGDSARVAKWGVNVTASGNEAFKTTYTTDDSNATSITNSVVTSSAEGADGKKLVAPGTSGSLASYSIEGTPEVATLTKVTANLTLNGWTINTNEYYCPITISIKVGETTTNYNGNDYDSMTAFETAIESALNDAGTYNAANQNLAEGATISWTWAFEDTSENAKQTNEKDTALGNLATAPTIEFSLGVSVEQVD